jgi:23S rRNA U2552 (ribose-2'-O)-methylase RlmE/FtsJ
MAHDVVLQFIHSSHSYRCTTYLPDDHLGYTIFPRGHGVRAEMLGDSKSTLIGCCTLVSGVAVSAMDFVEWIKRSTLHWSITRVYSLVGGGTASSRDDLLRQLSAAGPPAGVVRLQCLPRGVETFLQDELPQEWDLHPIEFTHVLNAVEHAQGSIRWSVIPCTLEQMFRTPAEGPKRVPGQLCKAAGKLTEALRVAVHAPGPNAVAVDVGASPGGWTAVLAGMVHGVVAVDPAELDPAVLSRPNVIHVQRSVRDVEAVRAAVRSFGTEVIDLLVCDINQLPHLALDLIMPLLPLLRPGGLAVVTMKFAGRGRKEGKTAGIEAWVAERIEQAVPVDSVRLFWAMANTTAERICLVVRKVDGVGERAGNE